MKMLKTIGNCDVCGESLTGSSHYHCPNCWEKCSMMGHYDPDKKDYWCAKKPHPNPSPIATPTAKPTSASGDELLARLEGALAACQAFLEAWYASPANVIQMEKALELARRAVAESLPPATPIATEAK